jgi:hypothetical protein
LQCVVHGVFGLIASRSHCRLLSAKRHRDGDAVVEERLEWHDFIRPMSWLKPASINQYDHSGLEFLMRVVKSCSKSPELRQALTVSIRQFSPIPAKLRLVFDNFSKHNVFFNL